MKLKESFVIQDIDDSQFMVPVGDSAFHGIVKNNHTAAFIVRCLQTGEEREEIVDALLREYDVDTCTAGRDVDEIIEKLKNIGAIDERNKKY